ncbi:MAG: glutamate synthase large subunit [Alphaproteobacteria bacterium]
MDRSRPLADASAAEALVAEFRANAERLAAAGLYDPGQEHDACGVGFIAALDGKPSRAVVENALLALKAIFHRGAVDADGRTGDGAGIHVQIPHEFFRQHIRRTGHEPRDGLLAVGMLFLPRTDMAGQERCRVIVESEILKLGYTIYGWRQVPVHTEALGEKANATRPEIEQIMIANSRGAEAEQFEIDLMLIRRRIEKAALAAAIADFYVCSLSSRSIIYKGLCLAEQLTEFYPDLLDRRFVSNFAVYHQRYSTNTFPTWRLAQPFRVIAHNGEINTLSGNVNWMKSHEPRLASPKFGAQIEDLKPIVQLGSSDSAALDSVFELVIRAGRDLPAAKALLVPEAAAGNKLLSEEVKALYGYFNAIMEPWDGPAALAAYDGRWVLGGMDRNGLRPMRYSITRDGLLIAGSEAGMVRLPEEDVVEKGRLGPGQMIAVDLVEGRLWRDAELKEMLARRQNYRKWIRNIVHLERVGDRGRNEPSPIDRDALRRRQIAAGWTLEDLETVLQPMAEDGKEPVGSMGDDTPVAVLSNHYRGLHHFFRQNFSQVTNPPIDSLRERHVMSLATRLGNLGNILDEDETQCRLLQIESPVLTNAQFDAMRRYMADTCGDIDATFAVDGGEQALRRAIERIQQEAEDAVRGGCSHLVLSDRNVGPDRAAIPTILACGAVHTHLVRQSLRTFTSLNVRTGVCLDVHNFAVLIGVGATTVNAYTAEDSIADRHRRSLIEPLTPEQAVAHYKKAVDEGLLKIMSKLGISVISSYRGGYNFEAVGLSRALVAEFFPGMTSRISGLGLAGIQHKVLELHARAWEEDAVPLPIGGFYKYRHKGELHAFEGSLMHVLQTAVGTDSYSTYKRYAEGVRKQPPIHLRDLLDFSYPAAAIPLEEVESVTEIRKRLVAPGISLGALSPEAHETLSIAMNRIGAKSDSGEGGEDPARYTPRPNGDNASSAIKQIASGRFGVTAEYLNNCSEIEIKIAQGAKPGEGGQLPGIKVSGLIARLRHATPGVTLISPPPHHDIYSIEDLAQLIYDLKQINPEARVCVKLVARSGIGTIAASVAKAKADVILVSGHSGGTGASPQSSIKYVGVPWEMGVSEVHQVLMMNRLRHRIRLRADGGIKTGRDVVIAALLGAEEYGIGTASLVAMGCIMVRQCHANTCPVGVCTQDETLRAKFDGTPEKVVNLFSFIAEEVREILASLGARSIEEIVGRTELLNQVSRGAAHLDDLDFNGILVKSAVSEGYGNTCTVERNPVPDTLDAQMLRDAAPLFQRGEKMQLAYTIRNTQRAIGTRLSSAVTRKFGMTGLQPGHVTLRLRGSAGQSLGAFAVQGIRIELFGDANDYVGKGLSGGSIIVRPSTASPLATNLNTIIGNTVLYGATAGELFAAGQAGERFAVRNSGAKAVVEGCGANGCEYMTGGTTVLLGMVGDNFAAGMTGGMAFFHDPDDGLVKRINPETVLWQRVENDHWAEMLRGLIEAHVGHTQSRYAEQILVDWHRERGRFWQVVPKEIAGRLEHPLTAVRRPALSA